ncbi:ArdC family protein [Anaeroselena agilis]|uniref:Zincin-like metallopeptidase domain-containing protein n=1 Tax=Anaeroselena agilis TaxID=3063788 RepID=A0ABU3NXF0_9FIRM|nr:zincin-like metallopeptidase domain-containing protein [Selenomonadales bacterium 4137-cl]
MAVSDKDFVFKMVSDEIQRRMSTNTLPWRKPWSLSGGSHQQAVSWVSGKPYNGINRILLDAGEYATFKAISQAGGRVNKGAKGTTVVYWKIIPRTVTEEDGTQRTVRTPYLRYYTVFNIETQTTGLELRWTGGEVVRNVRPSLIAADVVRLMANKPTIQHGRGDADYSPSLDRVQIASPSNFRNPESYHSTLFHQLVHSTGHAARLNRPTVADNPAFGTDPYSREELVAEIGASMLVAMCGMDFRRTMDNSVAYIQHWLQYLRNDPRAMVLATAQAEKAVRYILSMDALEDDVEISED